VAQRRHARAAVRCIGRDRAQAVAEAAPRVVDPLRHARVAPVPDDGGARRGLRARVARVGVAVAVCVGEQIHEHGIVVRRAIGIGTECERRILDAIVEQRRLVGVGVPDRRAAHERDELRARERVVEPAGGAVEDIAVGVRAAESREQIGEARGRERGQRIFGGIGVQVSDDQRGRVTRARRVGAQPRGDGRGRVRARPVAVALAVAEIGIACAVARRSLRLPVIHGHRDALARGEVLERAREARPVAARVEVQAGPRVEHRR
jgi:hypothetical protein